MTSIVFYEVFAEEEQLIKSKMPSSIKAEYFSQTIQEAATRDVPAEIISVRTQSVIPMEWADRLKGIFTRSAGYDHLLAYQKKTGASIPCGYLPNYCSRAVAEHAILMIMALMRKLPLQVKNFESFQRDNITGHECASKNLLVFGVGHIGTEIVHLGRALNMNVKGVDLHERRNDLDYVSLEEGISWAHALVCAVPLTEQTKAMLNYSLLSKAQEGLTLINVSRGEVTPLADLQKLLNEQKLGALGMDVFEEEGLIAEILRTQKSADHPSLSILREMKARNNVLFTPHNAFNTFESVERKAEQSVQAVSDFLANNAFPDPIPDS